MELVIGFFLYLLTSLMEGGWVAWTVGVFVLVYSLSWIHLKLFSNYDDLSRNVYDHLDTSSVTSKSDLEERLGIKPLTAREIMKLDKKRQRETEKEV